MERSATAKTPPLATQAAADDSEGVSMRFARGIDGWMDGWMDR